MTRYEGAGVLKEIINYFLIFLHLRYKEIFFKPGFYAVCYIGTMPQLVQIETCFFYVFLIIHFTF